MKIVITGGPEAGKSTAARKLADRLSDHALIATDDYIGGDFEGAPERVLEVLGDRKNTIVEGAQAARLLTRDYRPDIVLHIDGGSDAPQHRGLRSLAESRIKDYRRAPVIRVADHDEADAAVERICELVERETQETS